MTWTSKDKRLGLKTVTPHVERSSGAIKGRAPAAAEIRFTPQELYGAMARCSHLHPINPHAVTFESETCRHLISQHVDDKAEHFFILPSADRLKDFSRSHMVGVLGAGIAYLQMVRDGYVWCDHFENLTLIGSPLTKRSPDFVFSRPGEISVAITESKATRGSSRSQFKNTVKRGYLEQVSPYLGFELSGAIASHGFSIGSWLTSPTRAELVVDHTAIAAVQPPVSDIPSNPGAVKRGNYLTVLSLMFGPAIASAARAGAWIPSETNFLTTNWLGRDWLLGFPPPYLGPRFWTGANAKLSADFNWAAWPLINEFALELSVAQFFFRALATPGLDGDQLAHLPRMQEELMSQASQEGGAIYPDGLAVLGKADSVEHLRVCSWDPQNGEFKERKSQYLDEDLMEPIFQGAGQRVGWLLEEEDIKAKEVLYLTVKESD